MKGGCAGRPVFAFSVALTVAAGGIGGAAAAEPPAAPGYLPPQFEVPRAGSYQLPSLGPAADATVIDTRGREVSLHDAFGNGVAVLAFVYTSCAEAGGCPLANFVMRKTASEVLARDDLKARVRFVSLSFDPARDTPEEMAKLAGIAPPGAEWLFLTTRSEEAVRPVLEAYGQTITREPGPSGRPGARIAHVLRVFLIDAEKRIRNIYSSSFLHSSTLLADIETVLMERAPRAPLGAGARPAPVGPTRSSDPRLGLPPVPLPVDDPPTPAKIALGRKLFFDRRLSRNGTFSCAMCHVPAQGFTSNEVTTPVGIEGKSVRRNAPTLYNVAYAARLFHDGRENRLEQQVWGPLLAANEMGNPSVGYVVDGLRALDDYTGLFEEAFEGRGPGMETIGRALAAYQRTLVSGGSAFDRWRYAGEEGVFDAEAERGFDLFVGKAGCAACHSIGERDALFTDQGFHDTGVGYRDPREREGARPRMQIAPGEFVELHPDAGALPRPGADLGRYEITENPADRWKFKTPTLRNVALTAPYMHDGSLATLAAVVDYYDRGGRPHDGLDPRIRPLALSAGEKRELVAFLTSLTGGNVASLVAEATSEPVGDPR